MPTERGRQGCRARKALTQGPDLPFGNKEAANNQKSAPPKD